MCLGGVCGMRSFIERRVAEVGWNEKRRGLRPFTVVDRVGFEPATAKPTWQTPIHSVGMEGYVDAFRDSTESAEPTMDAVSDSVWPPNRSPE